MQFNVNITDISSIDEVEKYWSSADFIELLSLFGLDDAGTEDYDELEEMLCMAITDFEPDEAATILLEFKLGTILSKGQIDQLSHEMQDDKVSEEYPDISLHFELFQINQLLYKAFNGRFPHVKATIIKASIVPTNGKEFSVSEELILKVFAHTLSSRSVVKRLFEDQLSGEIEFPEAANIIWKLDAMGDSVYEIITSEYWMEKEDFEESSFVGEYIKHEKIEED